MERTLDQIREWPPGLPVFGQITPFPSTTLYERLKQEGRLTRPTHWLAFAPFQMAHTPLKMTAAEVHEKVQHAWTNSYSPATTADALDKIANAPVPYKISHLAARLCFRGIYFPQKGKLAWLKVLKEDRATIFQIIRESLTRWCGSASPEAGRQSQCRNSPESRSGTQESFVYRDLRSEHGRDRNGKFEKPRAGR